MALLLSNVPYIAVAEAAEGMIPTAAVVEQMSRTESEAKIIELISRQDVQIQMEKFGLSKSEITQRLGSLSDSEIRQLTKQIDQAKFGGDAVVGILVIVVLVLLVIFLAKRNTGSFVGS